MKSASKILFALSAVLLSMTLAGCENLGGWNEQSKTVQTGASDTSDKPMDITTARLDNAPGVKPVPDFPVPQDRDLKVMTSKLSGGSVEIYDIDGGDTQMGAPVASVQPEYAGIPMATDPRVTVFPLDGAGGSYPGQFASSAPQEWPNSVLPMGHVASAGMTPSPDGWGDEKMDIVGGKLSPRVGTDVSSVYFPYGSANLGSSERSALGNVAETAKFAPVDRVSIEGYASKPAQTKDPIKAKILNLKESMNRAQSVSQELIQKGVPAEKIKTVAWGDTKPTGGTEAAQRRVDIVTGNSSFQ